MGKILIGLGVFALVVGLLTKVLLGLGMSSIEHMDKKKEVYEQHIGEKLPLDGDTLTIVDYNSLKGVYILSNGMEVNKLLVK
jgi:hypothetical protein